MIIVIGLFYLKYLLLLQICFKSMNNSGHFRRIISYISTPVSSVTCACLCARERCGTEAADKSEVHF